MGGRGNVIVNNMKEDTGEDEGFGDRSHDRRAGDVIEAYADTSKAKMELGWKSKYNLKDALSSAWKWEQKVRGGRT